MSTNYDSVEPLGKVKRWCSTAKEKIDVDQPKLFSAYNASMGGVDLLDQAVNNYRVSIQGKKWWWSLFTHMLNVCLVNAWRLQVESGNKTMDLLPIQREVARCYLRSFQKSTYTRKRPIGSVPASVIRDEGGHFPKKLDKQLRCRKCHSRVRWMCIKCEVTLCLERDCFIKFHTE